MNVLNPAEITIETFERLNMYRQPMIDFVCPESFLLEIVHDISRVIFTHVTSGGNLIAARRVFLDGGHTRIDFLVNPER